MTPSELTALLARINDRIRSAVTGASSLLALAAIAMLAGFGMHRIQPGMAKALVVLAVLGGLLLAGAYRFLTWQREEIYDDIVLQGFRHVHPHAVARRTATLVSAARRRQLADTLDRFVDAAVQNHATPVPVHRGALIQLRPQVVEIASMLRSDEIPLEPAGMVLLTRLITDGATSPLYRLNADPRELRRELDRIQRVLGCEQDRLAA